MARTDAPALSREPGGLRARTRPLVGITVSLGLWAARLLSSPDIAPIGRLHPFSVAQAQAVRTAWSTTIPVVAAAVVVLAMALAVAPSRLRFAP